MHQANKYSDVCTLTFSISIHSKAHLVPMIEGACRREKKSTMKAGGLKLLKQLADTGRGPGGSNVCKDQVEVMSGTLHGARM